MALSNQPTPYNAGSTHQRNQTTLGVIPSKIAYNDGTHDTDIRIALNMNVDDNNNLCSDNKYVVSNVAYDKLDECTHDVYTGSSTILDNPEDLNYNNTCDIVILANEQDYIVGINVFNETNYSLYTPNVDSDDITCDTSALVTLWDNFNTLLSSITIPKYVNGEVVNSWITQTDTSRNYWKETLGITDDFISDYALDKKINETISYYITNSLARLGVEGTPVSSLTFKRTYLYQPTTCTTLDGSIYSMCTPLATDVCKGNDWFSIKTTCTHFSKIRDNINQLLIYLDGAPTLSSVGCDVRTALHTADWTIAINTNCSAVYYNLSQVSVQQVVSPYYVKYTAPTISNIVSGSALCRLDLYSDDCTFSFNRLNPSEITAVQAVNYGYNMLKSNPYSFDNTTTQYSTFSMDGIIPYKNGTVCTQAKVGEEIEYKLVYKYPSTFTQQICARWYVQDLTSTDSRTSELLTPAQVLLNTVPAGSDVSIVSNNTTYKQFTLCCELYNTSELSTALNNHAGTDCYNYVTPLGTITLAYYCLTTDTVEKPLKEGITYNLFTAKGMCGWLNRLVIWGVEDATNALFISECDEPTWFPYPNGADVLDAPIIKCVPLGDVLYVFTEQSIYQYTYTVGESGVTLNSNKIHTNLHIDPEPEYIYAMEQMLTFKARDEYYMVVPANTSSTRYGSMIIAPISKPISNLIDKSRLFIEPVVIYTNLQGNSYEDSWAIRAEDGWVDGTELVTSASVQYMNDDDVQVHVEWRYDIKKRTWRCVCNQFLRLGQNIKPIGNSNTYQVYYLSNTQFSRDSNMSVQDKLYIRDKFITNNPATNTTADGVVHTQTDLYYIDLGNLDVLQGMKKKFRSYTYDLHLYQPKKAIAFYNALYIDNNKEHKHEYIIDESDSGTYQYVPTEEVEEDSQNDYYCNLWTCPDTPVWVDVEFRTVRVNGIGKGKLINPIIAIKTDGTFSLTELKLIWRAMTGKS